MCAWERFNLFPHGWSKQACGHAYCLHVMRVHACLRHEAGRLPTDGAAMHESWQDGEAMQASFGSSDREGKTLSPPRIGSRPIPSGKQTGHVMPQAMHGMHARQAERCSSPPQTPP